MGKTIVTGFNPIVSCFYIIGFEWRLSNEKGISNDPHAPYINFIWMAFFIIKDFRSDIVGCAAFCFFALSFVVNSCGKSEITDFNLEFIGKEKVAEFEISMNNFFLLNVKQSFW